MNVCKVFQNMIFYQWKKNKGSYSAGMIFAAHSVLSSCKSRDYRRVQEMSKLAVFFADGCEEIEGLTVVDMLRRAKLEVVGISITGSKEIHGSHEIHFLADTTFEEAEMDTFDGVILPGGLTGTANLGAHEGVISTIKKFAEEGKMVAAICAAPSVLGANGILQGKRATCHPGWEDKLTGAVITEGNAVVDGNIITSRGMGTAIDFSLAIIAELADEDVVANVKKGIVY